MGKYIWTHIPLLKNENGEDCFYINTVYIEDDIVFDEDQTTDKLMKNSKTIAVRYKEIEQHIKNETLLAADYLDSDLTDEEYENYINESTIFFSELKENIDEYKFESWQKAQKWTKEYLNDSRKNK